MKTGRKVCAVLSVLCIIFGFSACGCRHQWQDATCTTPKTCPLCGATEGEALGHSYADGYCTRCKNADPGYFDAGKYGFTNDYGMVTWVHVTSYSIENEEANAVFSDSEYPHAVYQFKDGVFNDYSCNEPENEGETERKNLTGKLMNTYRYYTVLNNDSISVDGEIVTILERIYDSSGNLIIKALCDSTEALFILEEQIDWEKSPVIEEDNSSTGKQYIYYFKQ